MDPPLSLSLRQQAAGLAILLCVVPSVLAFSFTSPCDVGTTISPDGPGSGLERQSLCPSCCKQPLNLTFSGTPVWVIVGTPNVDKCIALCSSFGVYAVTADGTCLCFDSCFEEDQVSTPEPVKFAALGNIPACLRPCFPPQATEPWCKCPAHSQCIPVPSSGAENIYRCCCNSLYNNPATLPDNSSVCLGFGLGDDLHGVTNMADVSSEARQ